MHDSFAVLECCGSAANSKNFWGPLPKIGLNKQLTDHDPIAWEDIISLFIYYRFIYLLHILLMYCSISYITEDCTPNFWRIGKRLPEASLKMSLSILLQSRAVCTRVSFKLRFLLYAVINLNWCNGWQLSWAWEKFVLICELKRDRWWENVWIMGMSGEPMVPPLPLCCLLPLNSCITCSLICRKIRLE